MGPCQRLLEAAGRGLGGAGAGACASRRLVGGCTRALGARTSHVNPGWHLVNPGWQQAHQPGLSPFFARLVASTSLAGERDPRDLALTHPEYTISDRWGPGSIHAQKPVSDPRHSHSSAMLCSGVRGQEESQFTRGMSSFSRMLMSPDRKHQSPPEPTTATAPVPDEASSSPSSKEASSSPSPEKSLFASPPEEADASQRFRVGRPRLTPIIKRAMPSEGHPAPPSSTAPPLVTGASTNQGLPRGTTPGPGDDVAGDVARSAEGRELHFCVVGSGPAGFYTADKLLKAFPRGTVALVDRLPSPFGLVRTGVAPDHPETKYVTNQFSRVASSDRLSYFGNVTVGRDIPLAHLRRLFSAVVLAYGAEDDRRLGVPGEGLGNCLSAREFVWWYNGHPDYVDLPVDLRCTDTAIILGQGNVGIDCARVLLRSREELQMTDIAEHALQALKESTIRTVHLVGRRGPAQAACTAKEVRELLGLSDVTVIVNPDDLVPSPADEAEMKRSRSRKRVHDLLSKAAAKAKAEAESQHPSTQQQQVESQQGSRQQPDGAGSQKKTISFKFFRSPKAILPFTDNPPQSAGGVPLPGSEGVPGAHLQEPDRKGVPRGNQNSNSTQGKSSSWGAQRVGGVKLEVTRLVGGEGGKDQRAVGTGEFEVLPGGLVLRSIGYKSVSVEGAPFDERSGTVPNVQGRVLSRESKDKGEGLGGVAEGEGGLGRVREDSFERGLYVVGWLKRGPTGIIGTNEIDATETVGSILHDAGRGLLDGVTSEGEGNDGLDATDSGSDSYSAAAYSDADSDLDVTVWGGGREGLASVLESKGVKFITWEDWLNIEWEERRHGKEVGKQREKFVHLEDMLHIAGK